MWIDVEAPRAGNTVTAPVRVRGRTNIVPPDPRIRVRIYDENRTLLAEAATSFEGETGKGGVFKTELAVGGYTGPATLEVSSLDLGPNPLGRQETGATSILYFKIK